MSITINPLIAKVKCSKRFLCKNADCNEYCNCEAIFDTLEESEYKNKSLRELQQIEKDDWSECEGCCEWEFNRLGWIVDYIITLYVRIRYFINCRLLHRVYRKD